MEQKETKFTDKIIQIIGVQALASDPSSEVNIFGLSTSGTMYIYRHNKIKWEHVVDSPLKLND